MKLVILPISKLDITFCDHRRDTTTLSLRVDGATIYSLDIHGRIRPSSGPDTVGAFASTDRRSLAAWLDPISGEFISTDATVHDALISVPIFLGLMLWVTTILHVPLIVALPLIGVILGGLVVRMVRGHRNKVELEAKLRECFRNPSATTG